MPYITESKLAELHSTILDRDSSIANLEKRSVVKTDAVFEELRKALPNVTEADLQHAATRLVALWGEVKATREIRSDTLDRATTTAALTYKEHGFINVLWHKSGDVYQLWKNANMVHCIGTYPTLEAAQAALKAYEENKR